MNRDIFTVEIDGYEVNGTEGEFISWRNIHGFCCNAISRNTYPEDNYSITPAGVYNITITDIDSGDYYATISCGDPQGALSPSIETDNEIIVFPGTINNHIIPGLAITLASDTYENDKFQIIIGGRWNSLEDRLIKNTIFEPTPSGIGPSSSVILRVTNKSGKDLRNCRATIINSTFVKQDQFMYDLLNPTGAPNYGLFDGYRTLDVSKAIEDIEGEQLIRATSNTTPYRIVTSLTGFNNDPAVSRNTNFDDAFYPFSNLGCTSGLSLEGIEVVNNEDGTVTIPYPSHRTFYQGYFVTIAGSVNYNGNYYLHANTDEDNIVITKAYTAEIFGANVTIKRQGIKGLELGTYSTPVLEYNYMTDPQNAPYVRIDLGRGNVINFNRVGISAHNIGYVGCYGSNDDVLEPYDWDEIDIIPIELYECYCYYDPLEATSPRVWYRNIINFKSYRHLKFAILSYIIAEYSSQYPDKITRLGRIELIDTPDRDESLYRNRPFVFFDQEELDSIFYSNDDPLYVHIDNISDGTCDVLIDSDGYDIYDYDSGKIYEKGVGITLDKKYVFADMTPMAGMVFKINANAKDGDYARIWISQGQSIFQLRKYDTDTGWSIGRNRLLLSTGTNEDGVLNDDEYCDIEIRIHPTKEIEGSEINPIEGLLYVSGESDQEFDAASTAKDYGTLDTGSSLYGTIRVRINNLLYSGDMIRFKFKSVSTLSIDNVYFGIAYTEIPDFYKIPQKVQVTFDDGAYSSVSLGVDAEKWSDWIAFIVNGEDDYLLSYSGNNIGNTLSSDPVYTIESYHVENFIADVDGFGDDYDTYAKPFDIEAIEVKNYYRGSTIIPLSAIVNKGIQDPIINVILMPVEITDALAGFGITYEEIS